MLAGQALSLRLELGVAVIPRDGWSDTDQKAIREQLDRILHSGPFQQSRRRQRFLEYIVNEALAGRSVKSYSLALKVFGRPETFDPAVDPVVRVEAGRLREKLHEHYGADGQGDPIRIDLPKGTVPRQVLGEIGEPLAFLPRASVANAIVVAIPPIGTARNQSVAIQPAASATIVPMGDSVPAVAVAVTMVAISVVPVSIVLTAMMTAGMPTPMMPTVMMTTASTVMMTTASTAMMTAAMSAAMSTTMSTTTMTSFSHGDDSHQTEENSDADTD